MVVDDFVVEKQQTVALGKDNKPIVQAKNSTTIELGTMGTHLIFTKPVVLEYVSTLPEGTPVMIYVKHAGQDQRSTD